jgi:hypothetical protein
MPALKQEQEKKKKLGDKGAVKAKAPDAAVKDDKVSVRETLRPGPEAKLKVGAAGDRAEKEADGVADAIMKAEPEAADETAKDDAGKKKEEDAPIIPRSRGPPPDTGAVVRRQPDPSGGQPNLDELANEPPLPAEQAEVDVARDEDADLALMAPADWSALETGSPTVSLKRELMSAPGPEAFTLDVATTARIRGGPAGAPLPASLRTFFEPRMGVDLGAVRIVTGPEARTLSIRLGARAFAHGRRIWLRDPGALADRRLMAHELVHAVQQGAARPLPRPAGRGGDRRTDAADLSTPPARAPPAFGWNARAPPEARHCTGPTAVTPGPGARIMRREDDGEDAGLLARGAERLADRLDSYQMLKVLIGRRLFTGETVPQTALNFVGAFMKFIGADETFEQMKQSGSLQRGFDHIRDSLREHDLTWDRVQRVFAQARDEFDWWSPIDSFRSIFGPFFSDVIAFGVEVLKVIAQLVAEAFVISFGPRGSAVWEKIAGIGDVIGLIVGDPLGFARNLISAVVAGVKGFGERIWTHIKAGLLAWVLGPFAAMGIQMPEKLDLKGIMSVILQVLGLSYPQLRPRIVAKLNPNGERKVGFVEKLVDIVTTIRDEGLIGLWRKFMEYVTGLQTTVINGVRDWVVRAVVTAGIRKLVAWSNPAGALIDILLTIYNVIVFFVERFEQILEFANSIFTSIGEIARNQITAAATAVERSLALTIPIIISFIVRLLGLPDITSTVRSIVTKIRAKIGRAVDKALDWIINKVKKLVARLVSSVRRGAPPDRVPLVLDGKQHHLWADDSSGRLKLMMASDQPAEVAENADEQSAEAIDKSEDYEDAEAKTKLQAVDREGDEAQAKVDSLNRRPASDRGLPTQLGKVKTTLEETARPLEQASQKHAEAAPVNPPLAENGTEPPENVGATDRTRYPFRRVIRLNEPLEASAGPWSEVTPRYEAARDAQDEGAKWDVSRNLERDHIPEFSLLTKVAQIWLPPAVRHGVVPDAEKYPFATLKTNLPVPDGQRKDANPALPVMVVRRFINNTVRVTSSLIGPHNAAFEQKPHGFAPKNAPTTLEARRTFVQGIFDTYGADSLVQDMQAHIDAIQAKYNEMQDGEIDKDAMTQAIRRSTEVLKARTRHIFGGGTAQSYSAGVEDDFIVPYSDVVARNELDFQTYGKLGDNGGYLEKHHLLEKEVVSAFKARVANVADVRTVIGEGLPDLARAALDAALGRRPDEERATIAGSDGFDAAPAAIAEAAGATSIGMDFKSTQNEESQGMALHVLNSVNAQLGSQGTAGVEVGFETLKAGVGSKLRAELAAPLETAAAGALDALAAGGDGAAAGREAASASLGASAAPASARTEATRRGKALFEELTGIAWDRWRVQQERVNQDLTAQSADVAPDTFTDFFGRYEALNRKRVADENRDNWFT